MGKHVKPTHPGNTLKELLDSIEMSQNKLCKALGVDYIVVNEICREKRRVSIPMCLRLGKYFSELGFDADFWAGIQTDYDLQLARIKGDKI